MHPLGRGGPLNAVKREQLMRKGENNREKEKIYSDIPRP